MKAIFRFKVVSQLNFLLRKKDKERRSRDDDHNHSDGAKAFMEHANNLSLVVAAAVRKKLLVACEYACPLATRAQTAGSVAWWANASARLSKMAAGTATPQKVPKLRTKDQTAVDEAVSLSDRAACAAGRSVLMANPVPRPAMIWKTTGRAR